MKNALTPGQMVANSFDDEGRTVDLQLFNKGIKEVRKMFKGNDDFFQIEEYLADHGVPEDFVSDIVWKNFQ